MGFVIINFRLNYGARFLGYSKIVYVNRNSLVNWLDRHKKEASNPQEFAGYLKKNAFQKAIEMICKNVQKPSTNSVPVKNPKGRDFGASSVTKNPEVRNEEKRGETLPPAVVYVQDPSDAPFFNRIEGLGKIFEKLTGSKAVEYRPIQVTQEKNIIFPFVINDRIQDFLKFEKFIQDLKHNNPHAKIILLVISQSSEVFKKLEDYGQHENVLGLYSSTPDMSGLGGPGTARLHDTDQVLADLTAAVTAKK